MNGTACESWAGREQTRPLVIGERINPCGNPRLAARLAAGDWGAIDEEARAQAAAGAHLLDVNGALPAGGEARVTDRGGSSVAASGIAGAPIASTQEDAGAAAGFAERAALFEMIDRVERAADLPLVIDSRHPWILSQAAVRTRRSPILSSLPATREALARWLPELARTGAPVVGLALDERGVAPSADERFACAERFVRAGLALGMPLEHLIVDCIALPAGAPAPAGAAAGAHEALSSPGAPALDAASAILRANTPALEAMRLVRSRLGAPLILGISNVSYGAPTARERSRRAAAFLAAALDAGLDYAIVNPLDERIRSMLRTARRDRGQGQVAPSQEPPATEKEPQ